MKVQPWHSVNSNMYHNNTKCDKGKNIVPQNLRKGTERKFLCNRCKELNRQGK